MKKIDLIIPIYNGEKYIKQLLAYLNSQTMKEFCAIFVDDGSTDNTYESLQRCLQDVSFEYILIHQENKGLPGARNAGLKASTAEWVSFMDCDDGLDQCHLEQLYQSVAGMDVQVGICGYQMLYSDASPQCIDIQQIKREYLDAATCVKRYYTHWVGVCGLIINRLWLESKGLQFDEECTYVEDIPFITQVLVNCDKVVCSNAETYLYFQHRGSLIHTPQIEKYQIGLAGFHRMVVKVKAIDNKAAHVFESVGQSRYYLATLRKGAALMPFPLFIELSKKIPFQDVAYQLTNLDFKNRIAGHIYIYSKRAFYVMIRMFSKDKQ